MTASSLLMAKRAPAPLRRRPASLRKPASLPAGWAMGEGGRTPSPGQDASTGGHRLFLDVPQGLDNVDMDQLYQLIPLLS